MYMHTDDQPIAIHIYIPVCTYTCTHTHTSTYTHPYRASLYTTINSVTYIYLPTPPLGQDMTQGQFLSGV